ncbi:MAG TPA: amidase [Actinomycetota bacterium]|nr:amidase [Actinomycetota bacterium]
MEDGERAGLAAELRARLAAAGLEVPADDAGRMERDLGLHLQRLAALATAGLGPADPPLTSLPPLPSGEAWTAPPAGVPGSRPAAASAGADHGRVRPVASRARAASGEPAQPSEPAPRPGEPGGLVEAARLVREGAASSAELVEAALARIEALDGRLGAFVTLLAGEARSEAAQRDLQRRRGEALGPLHGVPVAVKDLVDVVGAVTGAGSPKLAGNLAARDAEVVARLRAAGAVVVGKTRTHEFAYGVLTPGTANPWDLARIAGGSSGGSAAAVAAGLVPAAVGTDTAGSVRIPAACCGVVGFKPSLGRVPAAGVWPLSWSCDHVGSIAGDVAGAALLFAVMAGDPAPAGAAPSPHGVGGPRIGRLAAEALGAVDPAVTAAVDALCERMESAGARIDEVTLPLRVARAAVAAMVLPEAAAAHAGLLAETGEDGYGARVLAALRLGQSALAGEYLAGLRYRGRFAALVEGLLAEREALLLPTLPCVAPETGQRTVSVAGVTGGVQEALTALPGPFNCSGSPVVSLPVGLVPAAGGLPVGASLVGRLGGDHELLRLAAWVEAVAPRIGRPSLPA